MIETKFKDTEIGKIPEEWEVSSFGEQFKKLNAASYTWKETSKEGDCAYLHYGEIHTKYHDHLNVKGSDLPYISCSQARNFTKLQNGDLVMLNASEDYDGVNDCVEIEHCDKDLVAGQHTIPLRPIKDKFEKGFIGYIPSIPLVRSQLVENAVGTKVYGVTNEMLKTILIPIPTKVEQRRIATALSNVDALISTVEKKIEKKKLIKQGAMQQLLTGKKRLPGFKGEWVEKRLGEGLSFQPGYPFASKYFNNSIGIRLIKNRDLKSDDTIVYYQGDFPKEFLVQDGDLLVGMDGDFLPCLWNKGPALLNQRVGRLNIIGKWDRKFLYYYLYEPLLKMQEGTGATTVKHLSHTDIEKMILPIPDPAEQRAIASIQSNMDSEITALERKRDKLKELKQGMMQQLLTGKIRLVRHSG